MEYWLNGVGKDRYPPTWEGLYVLLEDAKLSQVAEELKKAVEEKTADSDANEASSASVDCSIAAIEEVDRATSTNSSTPASMSRLQFLKQLSTFLSVIIILYE